MQAIELLKDYPPFSSIFYAISYIQLLFRLHEPYDNIKDFIKILFFHDFKALALSHRRDNKSFRPYAFSFPHLRLQ